MDIQANIDMTRFLLILISSAILVSSCRSTRKIQNAISIKKDTVEVKPSTNPHEDSLKVIKENYNQLLTNHIEFETFSAKINTDYQGSDGKNMM